MSIIVKEETVNKQTYKINNLTKIAERNILQMILKNLRKELLTNNPTKKIERRCHQMNTTNIQKSGHQITKINREVSSAYDLTKRREIVIKEKGFINLWQ